MKKEVMVGKNKGMCNQSNESIRSEFTINFRRYSTGISDVEYSPTFPNTWKSFQQLTRFDSSRRKRYTVGAFPSPSFAPNNELSSSESDEIFYFEDATSSSSLAPPLTKEVTQNTPKRNRFSSGYILSLLFLKKQNSTTECEQKSRSKNDGKTEKEKRSTLNSDSKKRRLHKINSAPNIQVRQSQESKGILEFSQPLRLSFSS